MIVLCHEAVVEGLRGVEAIEICRRVAGKRKLLAVKLRLIRVMMDGISEEAELERVFDQSEGVLRPHLDG